MMDILGFDVVGDEVGTLAFTLGVSNTVMVVDGVGMVVPVVKSGKLAALVKVDGGDVDFRTYVNLFLLLRS